MPKVRVRIPVDVPVSDQELEALASLGKLFRVATENGLLDAVRDFAKKADRAIEPRRRRRRRP